jgi:hypothetical protein
VYTVYTLDRDMMPPMKRALLPLILLVACTAPPPPPGSAGPAEAVQALADALRKGDTAAAWPLLSKRTRAQADALAAVARGGSDAGPESGRQMLFSGALPGRAVRARELSQSGDSAEVQTSEEGDGGAAVARAWHVVREDGRWRVDLDLQR